MKSNATVLLLSTTVYPALIAAVVVSIEPRSSVTWCQDFVSYAQHLNTYIALHLEDTTDGYHYDFCVGLIRTSFVSKRHWFFSTCQIKMYLKFQTCQRRVARMEEGRWTRRRSWASSTRSSELSGAHQNPITEYFQSKNLLSWNLCDRPTEDFDPEQEDWEKAVKVRASFVFLSHLFNFCRQVCNKILNLDSNDMAAFQCKVRSVWRFNEILFVMKDIWSFM